MPTAATATGPTGAYDVPPGQPVVLDRDVHRLAGGAVLLGGDPGRLMRLRPEGDAALHALASGGPVPAAARRLAGSLVTGGLAHPRPSPAPVSGVTVIVPVRDRSAELARCLAAVGVAGPAVVVVDDGSDEPEAVAEVCRRAGVALLVLDTNRGPAAARNLAFAATDSSLVAFLDSDCVPPPDWLSVLIGHFEDPGCAAAAPRVRAEAAAVTMLSRYAADHGPLDMGSREALVRPGCRVPYLPTAALVLRRSAVGTAPFDERLRYGEDVDLIWRLHDAGWRVRYDPRTVVRHDEPARWTAWLVRRYRYGTSAALLAQRHGRRLVPLVLPPWTTTAWVLLLMGRPGPAVLAAAACAVRLGRLLRRAGLPARTCAAAGVRITGQAVLGTAGGFGGAGSVVTGPLLLAMLMPRRTRRGALVALIVPPLLSWRDRRPALDPMRWCALRLLDDAAYAAGVWRGSWQARTMTALRPGFRRPT